MLYEPVETASRRATPGLQSGQRNGTTPNTTALREGLTSQRSSTAPQQMHNSITSRYCVPTRTTESTGTQALFGMALAGCCQNRPSCGDASSVSFTALLLDDVWRAVGCAVPCQATLPCGSLHCTTFGDIIFVQLAHCVVRLPALHTLHTGATRPRSRICWLAVL